MASSLHRELGKPESEKVTYEFFQQLIKQHVREQSDLDFKRVAYNSQNQHDKRELAKDVCAMANSGGGWIICGIIEESETAVGFSDMEVTATTDTSIHELIENQIEPSLQISTRVYENPWGKDRILTIRVPDSADMPHILRAKSEQDSTHSFVIPARDGARTKWLKERDLRKLYWKAYEVRTRVADIRNILMEEAISHAPRYKGTCLVITASLSNPAEPSSIEDEVIQSFLARDSRKQYIIGGLFFDYFDAYGYQISVGDQRKIVRYGGRRGDSRIDFLDNGSISAFAQLGGLTDDESAAQQYPVSQPSHVRSIDIEAALAQVIDLIDKVSAVHNQSDVKISVRLDYGGVEPILIRRMYSCSDIIQSESESVPIQRFRTVNYLLPAQRLNTDVATAIYQISKEILNQGEIAVPSYLVQPD